jgi:hypothetical protein
MADADIVMAKILKDYTTQVPTNVTIGQIQKLLVEAGARQILTEYDDDGRLAGISFLAETVVGPRHFVLPVNVVAVQIVLKRDRVPPRLSTSDHAERVAWRITKDWLEAQLAIVRTEMVTLDQVMLPYLRDAGGRTVYQMYLDQQKALPSGEEEP